MINYHHMNLKKKKQCIEFGEEKPSVKIYFPLWSVN
jgi:hypothetical protein